MVDWLCVYAQCTFVSGKASAQMMLYHQNIDLLLSGVLPYLVTTGTDSESVPASESAMERREIVGLGWSAGRFGSSVETKSSKGDA